MRGPKGHPAPMESSGLEEGHRLGGSLAERLEAREYLIPAYSPPWKTDMKA